MAAPSLHPTPRYSVVIKEQIRTVGLALRKEGVLFLALLGIMGALSTTLLWRYHALPLHQLKNGNCLYQSHTGMPSSPIDTTITFAFPAPPETTTTVLKGHSIPPRAGSGPTWTPGILEMSLIPLGVIGVLLTFGLAGFVIPFGVWRSEDPARRSYHWAMPVARGPHTLAKVFSGWLWLVLVVGVYLGFLLALAAIARYVMGGNCGPSFALHWQWLATSFTASTLIYLATSTAVVSSGHARRWITAVLFLYTVTISFAGILGLHDIANALKQVMTGNYGMMTALFGGVAGATTIWLRALALWGALGITGVCVASYRRRDNDVA